MRKPMDELENTPDEHRRRSRKTAAQSRGEPVRRRAPGPPAEPVAGQRAEHACRQAAAAPRPRAPPARGAKRVRQVPRLADDGRPPQGGGHAQRLVEVHRPPFGRARKAEQEAEVVRHSCPLPCLHELDVLQAVRLRWPDVGPRVDGVVVGEPRALVGKQKRVPTRAADVASLAYHSNGSAGKIGARAWTG